MKRQTRRAAFAAAFTGLVLSIALAGTTPTAADARWGANYFPDVTLTTQDGKDVKFYDLVKGRVVAIDLIYTNCQFACPIETSKLARLQQILGDRMGRDVFFVSISIDPEHDTPAVLKAYGAKFNAGPGWTFLTGKMSDIDVLSRKLGLWSDPKETQDGHTPMLLLGNEATGEWMRTSALDNPAFTARLITDRLGSWKTALPAKSYTEAKPITTRRDSGEYLFKSLCASCHTVAQGQKIGPDLAAALDAHGRAWMAEYTLRPDVVRAKKDAIATMLEARYREVRMPNLSLNAGEVDAILRYVDETRTTSAASAPAAKPEVVPAAVQRPSPMIEAALALHDALARDTMVGVRSQAVALRDAASAARASAIVAAATALSRQTTLAGARDAFGPLGAALAAYAKSHGEVRAAGVRVAYCPMARKSWLQKDGPVQNPYYGSRMLACGELTS
jgi:protein SCO1/2